MDLEPCLGRFGGILGCLGGILGCLGGILGRLGRALGASWAKYRKKVECDTFFGSMLDAKMDAKIKKNSLQKSMCFPQHFLNIFFNF